MLKSKGLQLLQSSLLRRDKLLLLFLFIYLVLSVLLFDPKLFPGGDNAAYIILAESLSSGKGYKDLYLPAEPPHTQYPPGFPLLLSLPFLLFGSNIVILKFFVLLAGIGSLIFMYKICESFFREKVVMIMAFYVSVPLLITFNHWILSEMPFLCFSLGAIYFFMKARADKDYFYYVSFICATYSCFIRMAGISLILAMGFFLVLRKQYKHFAVFLLIFLAVFIPWFIRNSNIPHEWGYLDQLLAKHPYRMEMGRVNVLELLERAKDNFTIYVFTEYPLTLFPFFENKGDVLMIIGTFLTLFVIIGFATRIRSLSAIELYFLISLIILFAWPQSWSSQRFLLPILPFCILYTYFSLFWISRKFKARYIVQIVTGFLVLLNLLYIIPQVEETFKNNSAYLSGDQYAGYTPKWRVYFGLIDLIRENVPPGNIIMARKPQFVYLLAKRKSFVFPFTSDHNKIKDAINRSDYILIDNLSGLIQTRLFVLPVLQKEPQNYGIVGVSPDSGFYVLKVKK